MICSQLYYTAKPLMPRRLQLALRRHRIRRIESRSRTVWPIYGPAGRRPPNWPGWPEGKRFALLLTHDVETAKGCGRCGKLLQIERDRGFRSGFYFTPRRYEVPRETRRYITGEGFEVGLHGLCHDGKLYSSSRTFRKRAKVINEYMIIWNSCGFSSPCMQHNLRWNCGLDIKYAITTYDTDPFEPQGGGVGTVFPFLVSGGESSGKYVELPYTLCQDFTLFVLMKAETPDTWKRKLDWIVENGGMAHLKTHPDYMGFETGAGGTEQYDPDLYIEFLDYVRRSYKDLYWQPLPREIADFYSSAVAADAGGSQEPACPDILCRSCRRLVRSKAVVICGSAI
jgi:hypothetical protein